MVKIQLKEIVNATDAIKKLAESTSDSIPIKTKFKLHLNIKEIDKYLLEYDKTKSDLIKKIQQGTSNNEEADKQLNELLETQLELDYDFIDINLSNVESVGLSALDLTKLSKTVINWIE